MDSNSVEEIIQKVVDKIEQDPFIIHEEADIQAMIYNELCKEYPPTSHDTRLGYRIGLVHCEYYCEKNKDGHYTRRKFDIVIFNKEDAKRIDTHYFRIKNKISSEEIVKLDHVIEIKFENGIGVLNKMKYKESRLDSDIEKLTQFKELHKTHQKHDPNLYFVYVLRMLESKKKIDCIKDKANKVEEEIKNDCKNKGIKPILKFLFLEN